MKELLENSLDAGAKRIQIHISNGGFDLIKIIDNGHGIKVDLMSKIYKDTHISIRWTICL